MTDATVALPHSGRAPYEAGTWDEITSRLGMLKESTSLEMLRLVILHFLKMDKSRARMSMLEPEDAKGLPGLDKVLQGPLGEEVLREILPPMVDLALEMPLLFPEGHIQSLNPEVDGSVVRMSRRQVACLLAHMFFCTLLPQEWNKYSVNFKVWHKNVLAPTQAYLKVLLDYFQRVISGNIAVDRDEVWFARRYLETGPDWSSDPTLVLANTKVTCRLSGRMGDQEIEVELDFANENIGYGETGTQEELVFGMSPEMCPAVLVTPTLGPKEAAVFAGAQKVGDYAGYGMTTTYEGPAQERQTWKDRLVLAVDATNYFGSGNALKKQLENDHLERELNKAFCAFRPFQDELAILAGPDKPGHIATGHWGCGAFRGDREVKAIIQVMAATAARCQELFYYCFGDSTFAGRLDKVLEVSRTRGMTVAGLRAALSQFKVAVREQGKTSFFDWFLDNNA